MPPSWRISDPSLDSQGGASDRDCCILDDEAPSFAPTRSCVKVVKAQPDIKAKAPLPSYMPSSRAFTLQPCAVASVLPPEMWEQIFDQITKSFYPDGHPEIHLPGHCKCGKVQFRVDGSLIAAFWCHCAMCRWYWGQSAPSHIAWVEPAEALTVVSGKEHVKSWTVPRLSRNLRGQAFVQFCGNCGTNLNVRFSDPGGRFTLMWPWNFKFDEWSLNTTSPGKPERHGFKSIFEPLFHAHYENRAYDADDILPKLADVWIEGMPTMNNRGEIIGKVTFPMVGAYKAKL